MIKNIIFGFFMFCNSHTSYILPTEKQQLEVCSGSGSTCNIILYNNADNAENKVQIVLDSSSKDKKPMQKKIPSQKHLNIKAKLKRC